MISLKKRKNEGLNMGNILILLIALVGGLAGTLSTVYLVISLIGVIGWKIYRRIAKGIPMMK